MRRDSATAVKRRGERELSGAVRRSSPAEPEGRSNFIRYLGHTKIDSGRGRGRRDRETEKTSKRATPERGARKIILRDTGGVARPGHDRTTTRPSDPPRGPAAVDRAVFNRNRRELISIRCILNLLCCLGGIGIETPGLLAHYGAARASGCSRLTGLSGVALKQGPQHALRNREPAQTDQGFLTLSRRLPRVHKDPRPEAYG